MARIGDDWRIPMVATTRFSSMVSEPLADELVEVGDDPARRSFCRVGRKVSGEHLVFDEMFQRVTHMDDDQRAEFRNGIIKIFDWHFNGLHDLRFAEGRSDFPGRDLNSWRSSLKSGDRSRLTCPWWSDTWDPGNGDNPYSNWKPKLQFDELEGRASLLEGNYAASISTPRSFIARINQILETGFKNQEVGSRSCGNFWREASIQGDDGKIDGRQVFDDDDDDAPIWSGYEDDEDADEEDVVDRVTEKGARRSVKEKSFSMDEVVAYGAVVQADISSCEGNEKVHEGGRTRMRDDNLFGKFELSSTPSSRCELVITANEKTEKLASGLLNPFLAHLKTAQDQVAKGGYSITLEPETDAFWFTKGTVERFVRFVSTPEILERVTTTETEILQIEDAITIQSNESLGLNTLEDHQIKSTGLIEGSNTVLDADAEKAIVLYKPGSQSNPSEANGSVAQEENSKVQLLRVLETRKIVLQKEQGMAFASATATDFDMDHMTHLIMFAECFGASRLKEACLRFMELWKVKYETGQWIEVKAAEAKYINAEAESVQYCSRVSGIPTKLEAFRTKSEGLKMIVQAAHEKEKERTHMLNEITKGRRKFEELSNIPNEKLVQVKHFVEVLQSEMKYSQEKLESIENDFKASCIRENEML